MDSFAPARTARFLLRLLRVFPDMRWLTRESVWIRLRPHLSEAVARRAGVDDHADWHHDQHMHLNLLGQDGQGKIVW